MRVPIRKAGNRSLSRPDNYLTAKKIVEINNNLAKLKKFLPQSVAEVKRLGEMGDFSENAAYGLAKARLRGLNQRILELENQLKHAQVISLSNSSTIVQLGSQVTVEIGGKQTVWRILGSVEANPGAGVISHLSPLGKALIGHKAGDEIIYRSALKQVRGKVICIE